MTPEMVSYVINGILAMFTFASGYEIIKKYKPAIENLQGNIKLAVEVIGYIKDLLKTCELAAADQQISPDEASKILHDIKLITESKEVQGLLKEFGA